MRTLIRFAPIIITYAAWALFIVAMVVSCLHGCSTHLNP